MNALATGRRAQAALAQDTTPGKILALALLANAPIFLGVVLVLLLTGGDTAAGRRFAPLILWATPLLAVLSLAFYVRAPPERRAHRASRIGLLLALVALVLWALVLFAPAR